MPHYICKDRYRLEIHWDSVTYYNDRTAILNGAKFFGPVLKNAAQINSPDHIDLDLTPQHMVVLDSYYIVRLSWEEVSYNSDGTISLLGAKITNDYLKSLHKLCNDDFIVVDTEKHEETTHVYHLVYDSQVIRSNKEPYVYRK